MLFIIQFNYIEGHLVLFTICKFHIETKICLSQRNGALIYLWLQRSQLGFLVFLTVFPPKTVPLQSHSHAPTFKSHCHGLSPAPGIVLSSHMNFVLAGNSINHLFALPERRCVEFKNSFQRLTRCSFLLDYIRFLLTQAKGLWKIIISP